MGESEPILSTRVGLVHRFVWVAQIEGVGGGANDPFACDAWHLLPALVTQRANGLSPPHNQTLALRNTSFLNIDPISIDWTKMGQRHQLFVIATVNGRYRTLAVIHYQWLYGRQAVSQCLQAIGIFSAPANQAGLRRELARAEKVRTPSDLRHLMMRRWSSTQGLQRAVRSRS